VRRHLSSSHAIFSKGVVRNSTIAPQRGIRPENIVPLVEADSSEDEAPSPHQRKTSGNQRGPIAELLYARWLEGIKRVIVG
jgi:hypothetical protein